MPGEYWEWRLARETGWSLEYIQGLPVGRWHEYFQIEDAQGKHRELQRERSRARRRR
jgi:hypothetical protein